MQERYGEQDPHLRPPDIVGITDQIIRTDGVTADRLGLRLCDDLSFDAWHSVGHRIIDVSESSAWWIGDWIIFGQQCYRTRYRDAIAGTQLDYQTLRNYAWVARKFDIARRRAELTFQHHMEVAALPPVEQDHWLDFAIKFGWSRNELRKQIKAAGESPEGTESQPDPEAYQLRLVLSQDRIRRWRAAARRQNLDLADWIANAVDKAAS
ncbi:MULTISPECIES: LmbU family transcriptional regulator [unclassified Streptomyces]|uniref:LmbU family transcriptional regulator n=1 Tax=unclassified Streptomyces TaxID=2593676 RepID=UPI000A44B11A|nr:LmbU family transcriptional regulator [Streptomyces sp. TSRI0281]